MNDPQHAQDRDLERSNQGQRAPAVDTRQKRHKRSRSEPEPANQGERAGPTSHCQPKIVSVSDDRSVHRSTDLPRNIKMKGGNWGKGGGRIKEGRRDSRGEEEGRKNIESNESDDVPMISDSA